MTSVNLWSGVSLTYFLFPQSTLPNFKQNEFSVVRQHEEFIWLHDSFVENEDYAGYIVRNTTHTHLLRADSITSNFIYTEQDDDTEDTAVSRVTDSVHSHRGNFR